MSAFDLAAAKRVIQLRRLIDQGLIFQHPIGELARELDDIKRSGKVTSIPAGTTVRVNNRDGSNFLARVLYSVLDPKSLQHEYIVWQGAPDPEEGPYVLAELTVIAEVPHLAD